MNMVPLHSAQCDGVVINEHAEQPHATGVGQVQAETVKVMFPLPLEVLMLGLKRIGKWW